MLTQLAGINNCEVFQHGSLTVVMRNKKRVATMRKTSQGVKVAFNFAQCNMTMRTPAQARTLITLLTAQ